MRRELYRLLSFFTVLVFINATIIPVARASNDEPDCDSWSYSSYISAAANTCLKTAKQLRAKASDALYSAASKTHSAGAWLSSPVYRAGSAAYTAVYGEGTSYTDAAKNTIRATAGAVRNNVSDLALLSAVTADAVCPEELAVIATVLATFGVLTNEVVDKVAKKVGSAVYSRVYGEDTSYTDAAKKTGWAAVQTAKRNASLIALAAIATSHPDAFEDLMDAIADSPAAMTIVRTLLAAKYASNRRELTAVEKVLMTGFVLGPLLPVVEGVEITAPSEISFTAGEVLDDATLNVGITGIVGQALFSVLFDTESGQYNGPGMDCSTPGFCQILGNDTLIYNVISKLNFTSNIPGKSHESRFGIADAIDTGGKYAYTQLTVLATTTTGPPGTTTSPPPPGTTTGGPAPVPAGGDGGGDSKLFYVYIAGSVVTVLVFIGGVAARYYFYRKNKKLAEQTAGPGVVVVNQQRAATVPLNELNGHTNGTAEMVHLNGNGAADIVPHANGNGTINPKDIVVDTGEASLLAVGESAAS